MSYDYSVENERPNENRPLSRRGVNEKWAPQNQSSIRGGENMQTGRPRNTAFGMRPPSTHNLSTRNGSRLSSGIVQPPKTGQSVMNLSYMNVLERPITQQGVTGMQTSTSRGSQNRQILDKRYYEGLIRMKMKDITSEIARLNGEIEEETQQQSALQIYEKRVKEIATELTRLQGVLADYNLVIDKINTGTDKSQMQSETNELKNENERLTADLDELFAQNRKKEDQKQQLENEIQNEKDVALKLIQEMSESEKKKYDELKAAKDDLQKEIEQYQSQLEVLTNRKFECEDKISGSQIKRETVRLYLKLAEREERKAALIKEEQSRSTPAQEREQLLQKVKEDNLEMNAIERQINQISEELKKKKEELELMEQVNMKRQQDLEENQTDRHQKFKELKKREETMEQFFLSFDEAKAKEEEKVEELEKKIVAVLQRMSKNLVETTIFPSLDEFSVMKENLTIKQEELENSKLTMDELNIKQNELSSNLKKVDELEQRIQDEISTIHVKMVTMNEELKIFSNLKDLKEKVQEKREDLTREKETLSVEKASLEDVKSKLERENESLTKELNENETYIQLNNLEKKLQFLEQNNKSIKEFIESKKIEMDYEPLKSNALKLLKEYNEMLIASCN